MNHEPAGASQELTIPAPGGGLPGHVAVSSGPGPWPGVVVLHERPG